MKTKIEKELGKLVGLEVTRTTRAANMECLKFGTLVTTLRNGEKANIGEFGLHLQCAWRITNQSEILTGDLDLYDQPNEFADYDENFNWDTTNGNLRDIRLTNILKENKLVVKGVEADNFGGFDILFENNMRLSVFPNVSNKSEHNELWRLMDNRKYGKRHFVVNVTGID